MAGRGKGRARHRADRQAGYPGHGRPRHALSAALDRRRPSPASIRDVQLGHRWMDAMSVDYSCLFPTGMLNIGLHPQKEMEVELCWAYNRWLTEKVLPESGGRFYSMLCLPFSDPDAGAAPCRDLRRPQGRHRLHGHDRAHLQVQRQRLHEGLSRDGGARPRACRSIPAPNWREPVFRAATASSRCTRSASRSTTSCIAPIG